MAQSQFRPTEAEADKRLRSDGHEQFVQLTETDEERIRSLIEDPWVDHDALNSQKSPITQDGTYKFFVLGAGFGGLQYTVRLLEQGLASADDIRLADAAGGFGGTWYWNRYPGLHCDLESYIYLPLLEETGYIPKQRYSTGEEVRQHAERIASQWKLGNKTLFRSDLWNIKLTQRRGPSAKPIDLRFHAHYVYLAAGVLTRPQIPKIPGLLSFSGSIFHTARWNYGVSGGSPADWNLIGLRGKKVAVVGTAATAIGVVPEVAKYAGELYVIQRTPAYVKQRDQRPTDIAEFRARVATGKGWQWERQRNFNLHQTNAAKPGQINLVDDAWTDMPAYSAVLGSPRHGILDPAPENLSKHVTDFHALDLLHMEAVRARVESLPWYPSWCKRPTFSDTYLQAFNEPHVHLVDTDGKGPTRATEKGLIVGDREYELDVIIFGTGYRAPGFGLASPASRTGIEVIGRGGQSLDEKWQANGAATLHGYSTNGFPNLWFSANSQATTTGNNVMMLGLIAEHVVYQIAEAERRVGAGRRAVVERAPFYASLAGCTPGYFNSHGEAAYISDPTEKLKRTRGGRWSEGTLSFLDYLQRWKDEGSLIGLRIEPARMTNDKLRQERARL
ncbi:FAD/NAD(P)-binding domain-containing protein [Thozetella sp. PMI_491]|nr:FAD/NAD(P)-binding domain-containing protein [Thozetella sp. PMI_491]